MSRWRTGNRSDPGLLAELRRRARVGPELEIFVDDGWLPLVRQCHAALIEVLPEYELLAVKEKYGALAFQAFPRPWVPGGNWTDEESDLVEQITDAAAAWSALVCEHCGLPGELREDREHLRTLCDQCDRRW